MNKEQQELLDEVYENYRNSYPDAEKTFQYEKSTFETRRMTKDEFIDMIKSDVEYGRRWGLKIEEREMSLEVRIELTIKSITATDGVNAALLWELSCQGKSKSKILNALNDSPRNIPTKLITITYNNDKTIESYE